MGNFLNLAATSSLAAPLGIVSNHSPRLGGIGLRVGNDTLGNTPLCAMKWPSHKTGSHRLLELLMADKPE